MATKKQSKILRGSTTSFEPIVEETLCLEDILAEFGGDRKQSFLSSVEQEAAILETDPVRLTSPEHTPFSKPEPPTTDSMSTASEPTFSDTIPTQTAHVSPSSTPSSSGETGVPILDDRFSDIDSPFCELDIPLDEPDEAKPITAKDMVRSTVGAVMDDGKEPIMRHRQGLFSRKLQDETEQLYGTSQRKAPPPPPSVPERLCSEMALFYRKKLHCASHRMPWAWFIGLLLPLLHGMVLYGLEIPYWTMDSTIQSIVTLGWLLALCFICSMVFSNGISQLRRRRLTVELLVCLAVLVSMVDCVVQLLSTPRSEAPLYGLVSGVSLVLTLWGVQSQHRGQYEMFRAAALDDAPPYLVTQTAHGAAKQMGTIKGFYTTAMDDDICTTAQAVVLPLILVSSLVFALLSSFGQARPWDFALNWSAILGGGATASLSLAWGLPWANLSCILQKSGAAVAGYSGAKHISQQRTMVVTDGDLFPSGTMQLNGYKLYGENLSRAASYAAGLSLAANSGLGKVFDRLARSESATVPAVTDFQFCEQGGFSGSIYGESVLLGTASFMQKMDIRLPNGLNLKTGIFLSVDGQLSAIFAVKYHPSEHVYAALRMMRHNRVMPILAARDPNVTPALLHRKFTPRVLVTHPSLAERIALSEIEDNKGIPHALLLRGGLLPYAKTVVGARRLCSAVTHSTFFGLFSSVVGIILSFYMVFLSEYTLLSPMALLLFTLLWTVPVILRGFSVKWL